MRVVVDANIAIAALLKPNGWSGQELRRDDVTWIVPDVVRAELADLQFAQRAGIEQAAWTERVAALLTGKQIVSAASLREHSAHPDVRIANSVDPDDVPYVAAAIATGADFLWSGTKQSSRDCPILPWSIFRAKPPQPPPAGASSSA